MVKNLSAMWKTQVRSLGREDPWRREWQPIPVFLPGESMDRGAWQAIVHGVKKRHDLGTNTFTFHFTNV